MEDCIITNSIVDMLLVTHYEMHEGVGEHGYAILKGMIKKSDEKKVIRAAINNEFASFSTKINDSDKLLFAGIILDAQVSNVSGTSVAMIKLGGATKLLANSIITRTFQDASMTFDKLIAKVNSAYSNISVNQNVANGNSLTKLIVQYKEDDWTFLTRIASMHNQPLIPRYKNETICYDFGLNAGGRIHTISTLSYSRGNAKVEYKYKKENGVTGISPDDFSFASVTSRDMLQLGDKISFDDEEWFVYQIDCGSDGAELIFTYNLRKENGFKVETLYNWNLTGASLNASIISASKDNVKVSVQVDGEQDEATAKWFSYSTVYSSPDGTGWYCMPEQGDSVRLYFPDEIEDNGYIISSIHTDVNGTGGGVTVPRSNPDYKSISTKYKKQIELTPTTIMMTNNNGMSIVIDDEEGIAIVSNKNISVKSDESIDIMSATAAINVNAQEQITLTRGESSILMKEDIRILSSKVYMQ